jgi:hypothetical protein
MDIAKNRNGSVGEIIVGCNLKRGLLYDLGTDPGTSAELAEAPSFGPLRISSTNPVDLPF